MLFANKLKELREEKQLLQRQLASALEIDTPMYSRIERGGKKSQKRTSNIIGKVTRCKRKGVFAIMACRQSL